MMERGLKHKQIWNDGVAVAGSYRPQEYIVTNSAPESIVVGDALFLDAPIAAMDLIVPGLLIVDY